MKYLFLLSIFLLLGSCATKVPYTSKLKADLNFDDAQFKKLQFYSSRTIILERKGEQERTAVTGRAGDVQVSSSSYSERIIIPANRPCIFDGFEEETGAMKIRFELGAGRYLRFKARTNKDTDRFYLYADWKNGKGELDYGGAVYYAVSGSEAAFIQVKLKQWQRNKRKDRVVKGLKV